MSISIIEQKLAQLRSHIRLMFLSYGLAKLLMWVAGLALWLYWSDRVLDLPGPARIGFLVAALMVLAVVFIRNLVYPLSRTLSDEDLALLVEREYPLLNDRLITSLQVLKNQERYKDVASGKMIEAVVSESFDLAGKLQFGEAVRSRRLLFIVLGSILAMTMVFGHAVFARDSMSVWIKRMFGGATAWPTRTKLDVQFLEQDQLAQFPTDEEVNINFNKDRAADIYHVALGSDLRIIARPSGVIPDSAEIRIEVFREVKSAAGEISHVYDSTLRREMKREFTGTEGKPDYTVYFAYNKLSAQNPREDVYIRCGDALAGPYTITLIPPPELAGPLDITYHYEEYLRLPDRATTDRAIEGVDGTEVTFRFSTTKPLDLNLKNGSRLMVDYNVGSTTSVEIHGEPERGLNHYRAVLRLAPGMSRYQVRLVDNEGIANSKRLGDLMQVKEDVAPIVKILFSGDPLVSNQLVAVSRDAIVPIEFEMTDDYGVGGAKLFWRFTEEAEFRDYKPFETEFKHLREKPNTLVNSTYNLELSKLIGEERMPAGSVRPTIETYIQAYDLNQTGVDEKTGQPVLQSSRYSVMSYELYTVEDLRAKVSTQIRQIKTTVTAMLALQRELQLQSKEALGNPAWLSLDGEDGKRLRLELNNAFQKQNQLLRDAEAVGERFGVFAQAYQFSRLERDDQARPQEFRIQSVRVLLALAGADAELRQLLDPQLKLLEEAEGEAVAKIVQAALDILQRRLRRAPPDAVFAAGPAGNEVLKTGFYTFGIDLQKAGQMVTVHGDGENRTRLWDLRGATRDNTDRGRLYVSVTSSGGNTTVSLYKDSFRTALVARGSLNSATGAINLVQQENSGISGSVLLRGALPSQGITLEVISSFTPGCAEQAAALYGRVLSMGITPSERSELLGELERQQRLNVSVLEMILAQVKKWEGFDDILHGFRGLLDGQSGIIDKLKDIAKNR
ncbi:MAG: hypothetical protein IT462_11370 [Planctomycetes bacterium]|nr:hypothetical protein [Planctomycetota bacterium]